MEKSLSIFKENNERSEKQLPHILIPDDCQKSEFQFLGEEGISFAFQKTLQDIERVAPTNATVLISGETGTGKEIVARSIHFNSHRKSGPFIAVNCGAIPNELMESELFGYFEGAFTGAKRNGYKGKFQQADKGTIFLDEISELTPAMQVTLLRVLQEKKVTPLGSQKELSLDIRIIAATHQNLPHLVRQGVFREDLFYRLYVYPIYVPPLKERKEDIPYLVQYFCEQRKWSVVLTESLFLQLEKYNWPGNVRQLFNVLERMYIYSQGENLDLDDAFQEIKMEINHYFNESHLVMQTTNGQQENISSKKLTTRERVIKELMTDALKRTNGNVTKASKSLGIPRSTFYKRMARFGM